MADTKRRRAPPGEKPLRKRLLERHDPLTSLVLTIPVFLVYHLGILPLDIRNGVDLFTEATVRLCRYSVLVYIAVTVGIAAAIVVAAFILRKKGKIRPAEFVPVLIEGVVLAAVMFLVVGWATEVVLPGQIGGRPLGPLEKLVMSAGAGFHEEVVFRAGLFAGGAFLLARLPGVGKTTAILVAALVSSLLFSAIHYVGSMADDFTIASFTFRFIAGLYLAAVYQLRGFAVAVYTHAIYDLFVFFLVPLL
jgi:hypothetical protein